MSPINPRYMIVFNSTKGSFFRINSIDELNKLIIGFFDRNDTMIIDFYIDSSVFRYERTLSTKADFEIFTVDGKVR